MSVVQECGSFYRPGNLLAKKGLLELGRMFIHFVVRNLSKCNTLNNDEHHQQNYSKICFMRHHQSKEVAGYRSFSDIRMFMISACKFVDLYSSVGVATRYGLDDSGIESRLWAIFSPPVETGPGAHPAFYTMGTGSPSRKYSGRGVTLTNHSHLALRLKKE